MEQSKLYRDRNLQIIFSITLMAMLAVASIPPAFPKIMEALQISETDVGLLIVAYTLPGVIISPFIGLLADRFGRKRVLVPLLFLFGLAGGACALSKEFDILIALRVLQGIGGAGLVLLNLTILGDLYSGKRRAMAMGLNASVLGIGGAAYPLIGGALATLSWNYPFFLPLAAIPIGILTLYRLNNPEPSIKQTLHDYLGGICSYMKSIRVASVFLAVMIISIILSGSALTYLSLYLGISLHATPFIIGIILSGMSVITALTSSQMGRIVEYISVTNLIKLSFAICAIALALIPFMPKLGFIIVPMVILGGGIGIAIPSSQTYIAGLAPSEYRAGFMSINTTVMLLGMTLGPLIFGLFYTIADFNGVFFYGAGLALLTAIIGFVSGKILR